MEIDSPSRNRIVRYDDDTTRPQLAKRATAPFSLDRANMNP
jgi:hypothetical protein